MKLATAERLTSRASKDMLDSTEYLLYNAAYECGYHTGYGIITSDEWNAIVQPMVEKTPEDILYGAYAVFTAWGWADSEIVELTPGKKWLYERMTIMNLILSNMVCQKK